MSSLRADKKVLQSFPLRGLACALLIAVPAYAGANAQPPRDRDQPRAIPNYHVLTDTPRRDTAQQDFAFFVSVKGGGRVLWSGELYLAEYNGARLETDLQDVNPACGFDQRRISSRNSALVLTLAPVDLVEGYRFRLKAYWKYRLPDCEEMRSEMVWLNLPVEIAEGETKTFAGSSDFEVELTRRKWPE
ncbi:hypothetical protein [Erythrobacter longus]|uniref:hypothetical protein n=1 Tax=Erythrobacter longus TaxID=1044 RepID=UPI000AC7B49D|nr:hypothetical protein [Erythrobacter longus]